MSEVMLYDLTSPAIVMMEPSALTIEIRNNEGNNSDGIIVSIALGLQALQLSDKTTTIKV